MEDLERMWREAFQKGGQAPDVFIVSERDYAVLKTEMEETPQYFKSDNKKTGIEYRGIPVKTYKMATLTPDDRDQGEG